MRCVNDAAHTLQELVDLYLLRCEVEGKSPQTVRAYRETLGRFLRSVPVEHAAAVTTEPLYGYLARFTQLSLETRHRYFREVRCFFNWLVDTGQLDENPFRGTRNVRLPQRIVQPLSPGRDRATASGAGATPQRPRRETPMHELSPGRRRSTR